MNVLTDLKDCGKNKYFGILLQFSKQPHTIEVEPKNILSITKIVGSKSTKISDKIVGFFIVLSGC